VIRRGWLAPAVKVSAAYGNAAIRHGWLAPAVKVSAAYGNAAIWPGDTLGISPLPGGRISLTWGSATGTARQSAIYASVVTI
jgi:hypothetical protein